MPCTRRNLAPKIYEACRGCPNNISGYGKCKMGFDNFYYRRGKDNRCFRCRGEIEKWLFNSAGQNK